MADDAVVDAPADAPAGLNWSDITSQVQTYAADSAGVIGSVAGLAGSFKAFFNKSDNTVTPLSGGVGGPAAAPNTPKQYVSSGALQQFAKKIGLPVWGIVTGGLALGGVLLWAGWKFFFKE